MDQHVVQLPLRHDLVLAQQLVAGGDNCKQTSEGGEGADGELSLRSGGAGDDGAGCCKGGVCFRAHDHHNGAVDAAFREVTDEVGDQAVDERQDGARFVRGGHRGWRRHFPLHVEGCIYGAAVSDFRFQERGNFA